MQSDMRRLPFAIALLSLVTLTARAAEPPPEPEAPAASGPSVVAEPPATIEPAPPAAPPAPTPAAPSPATASAVAAAPAVTPEPGRRLKRERHGLALSLGLITIIEDGRPLDGWPFIAVLVHEYAHAIQDARFDLAPLDATHDTDLDRALGMGAVVEGDATYIGDLASAGFFGAGSDDIPWAQMFARWQDDARYQARRSPLPVTLSSLHFRYPFGTAFTKAALDAAGWTGVDGLFGSVPSGAREVMAGFGAAPPTDGPWAEDLGADSVPILGDGFVYVGADRLGAWLLEALLGRHQTYGPGADELPQQLRGDVLSIFHHPETGAAVAIWRLRLASAEGFAVLGDVSRQLHAARVDAASNDDLVIVAASDVVALNAVPSAPYYQAIPSAAPAGAPLAGRFGHGCVRPPR